MQCSRKGAAGLLQWVHSRQRSPWEVTHSRMHRTETAPAGATVVAFGTCASWRKAQNYAVCGG